MTARDFGGERLTQVLLFVGALSLILCLFAIAFRDGPWWGVIPSAVLIIWSGWFLRRERLERREAKRSEYRLWKPIPVDGDSGHQYAGVAFPARNMQRIQGDHWRLRCENCHVAEYVTIDPEVSPAHRNELLLYWMCDCA